MQARLGALQEQLASARSAPAKQTIVALQTSRPATWMGYVEKNRRLVRAARVLLRLQHRRLATAWARWEAQWHEDKRIATCRCAPAAAEPCTGAGLRRR